MGISSSGSSSTTGIGIAGGFAETISTYTTASLAAGNYEDITSIAMTFIAPSRPVLLELYCYCVVVGAVNVRPELLITDNSNVVYARSKYNADSTTVKPSLYARRIIQLTAGTTYTFKGRVGNSTGGTTGVVAAQAVSDAPMQLSATLR